MRPNIKFSVGRRVPFEIVGGTAISVTRTASNVEIDFDITEIAEDDTPDLANLFALSWDQVNETLVRASLQDIADAAIEASGWTSPTAATSAALAAAIATGQAVIIPPSMASFSIAADDVLPILRGLSRVYTTEKTTLTLPAGITSTASGDLALIGPGNANIEILGQTPLSLTMTSIQTVSGSTGAWDVTYIVSDATGVSVGQFLKNYEWSALPHLSGDNSVFRPRIVANELLHTSALLGNITAATGASTASFASVTSGFVLSDIIKVNDLLTIKGQTLAVSNVNDGTRTLTVTGGTWNSGVSGSRDYYVSIPNSGTIGTGGVPATAIVGSSTLFSEEANVGDLLLADGQMVEITAITDDNDLAVSHAITLANGTAYSIISGGILHEGVHEITGVTGNQITVRNKSRIAPPVNGVTSTALTEMKVIRTILKNTGTGDGFVFQNQGALRYLNNVVLQGPGASGGTHGIALNGRFDNGPTQEGSYGSLVTGDGFGVVTWGRGFFLSHGCRLQARKSAASGNGINVWAAGDGAVVGLREFVSSGATGRGIIISAGSSALGTEFRSAGNTSDGLFVLGSWYSEIPFIWGDGGMGVRFNENSTCHLNEGVIARCGASGLYGQTGRATIERMLIVANRRENIELTEDSSASGDGVWSTGASGLAGDGSGVKSTASRFLSNDCAFTGNDGAATYALDGGYIRAPSSQIRRNDYDGRAVGFNSEIDISAFYGANNANCSASSGGRVHLGIYIGSLAAAVTPATLNQEDADGFSMVTAIGASGRVPKYTGINLTGDGTVTIKPTAPGTGTIDNVVIGGTTPLAGTFTTLTGSTQVVGHANNTAATPAYTFSGNTNSGFYRIASNRIGLSLNGSLVVDFQTGGVFVTGIASYTATNASAFAVGRLGSITPALVVDTSAATTITGVKVTARAAAGGVDVAAVGETNVPMRIDAAGSGTLTLNGTGTGAVSTPRAFTAASGTAPAAGGSAGLGLLVSSTANLGVFFGSGAPTISAAQGSLYLRTDGSSTSTRLYVNTNGTTGWTNVTTAT